MTLDATTILLTVIRESVSLFILLVFLFFSYKLLYKGISLFEQFGNQTMTVLQEIADNLES